MCPGNLKIERNAVSLVGEGEVAERKQYKIENDPAFKRATKQHSRVKRTPMEQAEFKDYVAKTDRFQAKKERMTKRTTNRGASRR